MYIYVPSICTKDGKKVHASEYGKWAFRIPVKKQQQKNRNK